MNESITLMLGRAIDRGDEARVIEALSGGADPNSRFPFIEDSEHADIRVERGVSMLHVAAHKGLTSIMHRLLDAGANPNVRDERGASPLHWSTMRCINILAHYGADLNARDDVGMAPLHYSIFRLQDTKHEIGGDSQEMMETLLAAGADVNCRADNGFTPLHLVCLLGINTRLETLAEYGADPEVRDEWDQSALDIVRQKGNDEGIAILSRCKMQDRLLRKGLADRGDEEMGL